MERTRSSLESMRVPSRSKTNAFMPRKRLPFVVIAIQISMNGGGFQCSVLARRTVRGGGERRALERVRGLATIGSFESCSQASSTVVGAEETQTWQRYFHFGRYGTIRGEWRSRTCLRSRTTRLRRKCRNDITKRVRATWFALKRVNRRPEIRAPRTFTRERHKISKSGLRKEFCCRTRSLRSTFIRRITECRARVGGWSGADSSLWGSSPITAKESCTGTSAR